MKKLRLFLARYYRYHDISSVPKTESGITPMQICFMLELVSGALNETLAKLNELQ